MRGNTGPAYRDRGRRDAPHNVALAKEALRTARHLRNMTSQTLAAIHNLSDRQAEVLLLAEQGRRERDGGE